MDVNLLQSLLKICGYDIDVDGIMGDLTMDVVKCFQVDNELKADGIYGTVSERVLSVKKPRMKLQSYYLDDIQVVKVRRNMVDGVIKIPECVSVDRQVGVGTTGSFNYIISPMDPLDSEELESLLVELGCSGDIHVYDTSELDYVWTIKRIIKATIKTVKGWTKKG